MAGKESETDQQQAANAFAGLFVFVRWARQNITPLLIGASVIGGGGWLNEHYGRHTASADKVDAGLTNDVKVINRIDTMAQKVDMVVAAVGTLVAHQSATEAKVDIITSDLMHDPFFRKIEQQRQDSIYRANRPVPFTVNTQSLVPGGS